MDNQLAKTEIIIIFITVPDIKTAEEISAVLVKKKLAACVNTIPGLTSVYMWQDEVCKDDEMLLQVKSVPEKFDLICTEVKSIHPYDLPEIIAIPVILGFQPYLDWVKNETNNR